MALAHRQDDARICGAATVVTGQGFVKIAGKLWAVDGDPNSHGEGGLITSHPWLKINGKGVIVLGDHAAADALCPLPPHCDPAATGSCDFVSA